MLPLQKVSEGVYLLPPNPLASSINSIIEQTPEELSRGLEIAKITSDLVIAAISALGFPFGKNSAISVKCYIIADTTPKIWAGFKYVDNHFRALSIRKKLCSKQNLTLYYVMTTLQVVVEISIGIFANYPNLYSVSLSSEENGSILLEDLGQAFLQMLSVQLMIRASPKLYYCLGNSSQSRSFWLKQEFISEIQKMKQAFFQMSYEDRLAFIETLQKIRTEDASSQRMNDYLSKMRRPIERNSEPSACYKIFKNTGRMAFFLAFVAYPFAAYPLYNWQFSKAEGISDGGAGVLSLFTCAALYLNLQCALHTIRQFYPLQWNLTSLLKRVKAVAYKTLGVCLSALGAYGFQNTDQCVEPTFSVNIPPALCIPFSLYIFTIANVSIHDFIDYALENSILAGENQEERSQILIKREFDKLIELFESAPTEIFMQFFRSLPDFIKNPLLHKFGFMERDIPF